MLLKQWFQPIPSISWIRFYMEFINLQLHSFYHNHALGRLFTIGQLDKVCKGCSFNFLGTPEHAPRDNFLREYPWKVSESITFFLYKWARVLEGVTKKAGPVALREETLKKEAGKDGRTWGQLGDFSTGTETNEGRFWMPYASTGEWQELSQVK